MEGHNTLIIQPTGSGKSQLLPLITGKITVVLTSTISLMKDQCCALEKNGISATYLGSSQTDKEIDTQSWLESLNFCIQLQRSFLVIQVVHRILSGTSS